jgi:C4-dicarboxylate-specific signal transduction histidine kinase
MPESAPLPAAAESARFAVLRRIGPALKHDLVVNLQAVAMKSEVLAARLDKALPGRGELQDQLGHIHRLAREAVLQSLKAAAWLAPTEGEGIELRRGIEEGLALVRSNFGFRGFRLQAGDLRGDLEVAHDPLRYLLPAALLHLTDQARHPGELTVEASVEGATAVLVLDLVTQAGTLPAEADESSRPITADDLQALAGEGDAQVLAAPDHVELRLPRLVASGPLQIAPH